MANVAGELIQVPAAKERLKTQQLADGVNTFLEA